MGPARVAGTNGQPVTNSTTVAAKDTGWPPSSVGSTVDLLFSSSNSPLFAEDGYAGSGAEPATPGPFHQPRLALSGEAARVQSVLRMTPGAEAETGLRGDQEPDAASPDPWEQLTAGRELLTL
jgi:hypothetical protein